MDCLGRVDLTITSEMVFWRIQAPRFCFEVWCIVLL